MRETSDKADAPTPGERCPWWTDLPASGSTSIFASGAIAANTSRSTVETTNVASALGCEGLFPFLRPLGRQQPRLIIPQASCLSPDAHVMEIDRIKYNACLGAVKPGLIHEPPAAPNAVQDDERDPRAFLLQIRPDRSGLGAAQTPHSVGCE